MKRDDKFGSPFDPFYRGMGKIIRPQSQEEKREHQLRGCGDPNCPQCNPETANRPGGAPPMSNMNDAIRERIAQSIRKSFDSNGIMYTVSFESDDRPFESDDRPKDVPRPTNRQPPSSYREAREAVQQWIITAPDQSFDDIVGNDEALLMLVDAIRAPVEQKALYDAYEMTMPKGAMLYGPPGCGKTMFARAAASEMKRLYGKEVEFLSISGAELQSMYVGETEQRIKAIFTFAREYKAYHGHPLLVFMDEADVLLPDRTGRVRRVAPWEESQVATFLAEMDGVQASGAFVLLATNRPEVIDQAVLRDGRCDFKIMVRRPNAEAIETILRKAFAPIKSFQGNKDDLVFAALEAMLDPAKVIREAHMIQVSNGKMSDLGGKSFLLEHILSGAMAVSVPARAKRHAFARDKATGQVSGISVGDVVAAVNDIFAENRELDHAFALEAFKSEFEREMRATGKMKGPLL